MASRDPSKSFVPNDQVLTVPELKEFINRMVDKVFAPENDQLRRLSIKGLSNPQFLSATATFLGISGPIPDEPRKFMLSYLEKDDKEEMRSMLLENADRLPQTLTRRGAESLLAQLDLAHFRKAMLSFADRFKGAQGRAPKLRISDYPRLVARADVLAVLITKILAEFDAGTAKEPFELLLFWQDDHPEGASFLLGYYAQFEQALRDPGLNARAKRVNTRARLISDAVAGAEYGLSARTSVERVRQARRAQQSKR